MSESRGKQFGEYEAVRELNQVGAATIYAAHRAGAPAVQFAVKALRVPIFLSAEDARQRVSVFIARAALQKRVASGAGDKRRSHWAPIHGEPAALPDGAYYVSDLYQLSAAQLAEGRRGTVTAAQLHAIISQTVEGVKEIQAAAGRPHGNLAPGNVLIRGRGAGLQVFLADPLEDDRAAARAGVSGDLRAIGQLIHQLVVHAPAPAGAGVPLPDKSEWRTLGEHGNSWRELCGRLLGAGEPLASLEELSTRLASLRPQPHRVWKRAAVLVGVLAVLAICGAWTVRKYCPYNDNDWRGLCKKWKDRKFQRIQSGFDPYRSIGQDSIPDADRTFVKSIVDQIQELNSPYKIANKPPETPLEDIENQGPGLFHCEAGRQVVIELKKINAIEDAVSTFARANAFDVNASIGTPLPDELGEILRRVGRKNLLAADRKDAQNLQADFGQDEFVGAFSRLFLQAIDNPQTSEERLKILQGEARTLLEINRSDYDLNRIGAEVSRSENRAPESVEAAITHWRARASDFRFIPDPRPEVRKLLLGKLDELQNDPTAVAASGNLIEDVKQKRQVVDSKLQGDPDRPVQADQVALDKKIADTRMEIEGWIDSRHFDNASWVTHIEERLKDPPVKDPAELEVFLLSDLWPRYKAALKAHPQDATIRLEFSSLLTALEKLSDDLHRDAKGNTVFDSKHHVLPQREMADLPQSVQRWAADVDGAGEKYCDKIFRQKCDALKGADAKKIAADLQAAAHDWTIWRETTRAAVIEAGKLQSAISAKNGMQPIDGQDLSQRYSGWLKHLPEWQEALRQSGISIASPRPLKAFDLRLDSKNAKSFADALRLAGDDDAGALLATWLEVPNQLTAQAPPDFTLKEDVEAFDHLGRWVGTIQDQSRQNEVAGILHNESIKHWQAWAKRPAGPGDDASGITSDNPAVRYNAALYQLRRTAERADEADDNVKKATANLQDASRALPPPAMNQAFLASLAGAVGPTSVSLTAPWDPEVHSKAWKKVAVGQNVAFDYQPASGRQAVRIEFAAIEVNGKPVYLSTTEVSAGLFFAMADDLAAADKLQLAVAEQTQLAKKKNGPNVWNDKHQKADDWIVNPNLAPAFRVRGDPPPSLDHPMQFVSAAVASQWAMTAKFRLPTEQEWAAAWHDEQNNPRAQWNLRDASWKIQRDFFVQAVKNPANLLALANVDPEQWDIFDPVGEDLPKTIWSAQKLQRFVPPAAGDYDDKHLFLLPALPSDNDRQSGIYGRKFYHLLGNAAEIVTRGGGFGVIGGSAFSSPGLELDKAADVGAAGIYPDVGFRLALDPPIKSARESVAQVLKASDPPFVAQ